MQKIIFRYLSVNLIDALQGGHGAESKFEFNLGVLEAQQIELQNYLQKNQDDNLSMLNLQLKTDLQKIKTSFNSSGFKGLKPLVVRLVEVSAAIEKRLLENKK